MMNVDPVTCIAGAGIAGYRAAKALLRENPHARIIMLGQENHPTYSRPGLSKAMSPAHRSDVRAIHRAITVPELEGSAFECRFSTEVVAADLDNNKLTLRSDEVLAYDALVVATGVRARRSAPGVGHCEHHTHRTLRDVRDAFLIHRELEDTECVAIIGNGFVACELASLAVGYGCRVTMLDVTREGPFQSVLGPDVARALRAWLVRQGVSYRAGEDALETVRGFGDCAEREGAEEAVCLPSAARRLLIEAVGSVPNSEWLARDLVDPSGGVVVDGFMHVPGYENVFAAGDLAVYPDPWSPGSHARPEFWKNAIDTGAVAGRGVAHYLGMGSKSGPIKYLPSASTDILGLRLQIAGNPRAADSLTVAAGNLFAPEAGVLVTYRLAQALVGVAYLECGATLHSRYVDLVQSLNHR